MLKLSDNQMFEHSQFFLSAICNCRCADILEALRESKRNMRWNDVDPIPIDDTTNSSIVVNVDVVDLEVQKVESEVIFEDVRLGVLGNKSVEMTHANIGHDIPQLVLARFIILIVQSHG